MKSVTVSTQRSINFGAVLQSYALQQTMIKLGSDNQLLDVPAHKTFYEKVLRNTLRSTAISLFVNAALFLHKRDMLTTARKFDEFVNSRLFLTDVFGSVETVIENPPDADFYLDGSDQVFGVRGEWDAIRMLQFGDLSIKRFSYAASLGEYDWNEQERSVIKERLEGFTDISVREQYAKIYLEEFLNRKCNVHVDPVFLLSKEEWRRIMPPRTTQHPYILCYPLVGNDATQSLIDSLKQKTGFPVVCIHTLPIKRIRADSYVFNAGPEEFLSLFANAEMIVTTSFHGTAFSLIYEKPFYTLIKDYKSQRMTDLLDMVGLSDRIYRDDKPVDVTSKVDFTNCREVIKKERERGISYLKTIIEEVALNDEEA